MRPSRPVGRSRTCSMIRPLPGSSSSIPNKPTMGALRGTARPMVPPAPTAAQRQEMDWPAAQLPAIWERSTAILAVAEELKANTIETLLAKSGFELGLDWLPGKRQP